MKCLLNEYFIFCSLKECRNISMNSLSTYRSPMASALALSVWMKYVILTPGHTRAITYRNIVTLSVFATVTGVLYVKDLEVDADDAVLRCRRRGLYGVLAVWKVWVYVRVWGRRESSTGGRDGATTFPYSVDFLWRLAWWLISKLETPQSIRIILGYEPAKVKYFQTMSD